MLKYSVVIPMFNSEKTIITSIESFYKQTHFDLIDEVIIVDDGSNDCSVQMVNEFLNSKNDSLIKVISKVTGGVASARNLGIKKRIVIICIIIVISFGLLCYRFVNAINF